ncbi:MAG: PhzF family phenazine biosynthesis isomerase [Gemmatimonadales bacterium]|nr:PhzF family phenazine biosynthesis isomerase [Gemmatimonadales bacterium]
MPGGTLLRLAAFTTDPTGGNPAGVWIGDQLPTSETMQRVAAEVGYSETAFVAPALGAERTIRYFSPATEVPFCGHATIATGVALGEREGDGVYHLATSVGVVPVVTTTREGRRWASLTSVAPRQEPVAEELVDSVRSLLGWAPDALDPSIPPVRAYAGAWHLVLATTSPAVLNAPLVYDFDRLLAVMLEAGLVTLQLIFRDTPTSFQARNPFPVGGVVEDPATGAAAAALAGYLRDADLIPVPARVTIRQGEAMGRPSRLEVEIPERGGIILSGTAVPLP